MTEPGRSPWRWPRRRPCLDGWQRRAAGLARGLVVTLALLLTACSEDPAAGRADPAGAGVSGIRYLAADGAGDDGYSLAFEPRAFVFPDDHLAHPDFRTEWWYLTGNVFDAAGDHYGFELTLFRIALAAAAAARESDLATNQVWMGHLAVTDTRHDRFQATERFSRGAAGLAGASRSADGAVRVALEDWSLTIDGDRIDLVADDTDFGIALSLTGAASVVPQGQDGLDAKGPEPGNASYYYSAPRLAVSGELRSGGREPVAVSGTAWLDREWSTSALSPDMAGWDWFALQLDDGRNLMFYRLRAADGSQSEFSSGSLVAASGALTRLTTDDVALEVSREWTSPATGVRYPVAWRMAVPAAGLELAIEPRIDDQELDLTVRYWEGAIAVSGRADGQPVAGVGYLELAGY